MQFTLRCTLIILPMCAFLLGLSTIGIALQGDALSLGTRLFLCLSGFTTLVLTFAITALTASHVILEDLKCKLLEVRIEKLEKENKR